MQQAIAVTERAFARLGSPTLASNLVIYKSLLGTVTDQDWERLHSALNHVRSHGWGGHKAMLWNLMENVKRGFSMDKSRMVETIHIVAVFADLSAMDHLRNAVFIYNSPHPEQSLTYFLLFARGVTPEDGNLRRIVAELRAAGHGDWASLMEQVAGKGE